MADEQRSGGSDSRFSSNPPAAGQPVSSRAPGWRRSGWVRWVKRVAVTAIVVILLSGALLAFADHKTRQPEFCGSCHIMEPYYESWHADAHGGKLEIACVECHYAPGERTTATAKLRGLSQVTSYFSGRYGAGRPRAHVDNLSCLTSKCHGDLRFMDKEISLGTVKFKHAKHLQYDRAKRETAERELGELTTSLRQRLGQEHLTGLEAVARQAVPAKLRIDEMTRMVNEWQTPVEPKDLVQFTQLHHRQVRVAQLDDLQCTNCHSYVSPMAQTNDAKGPESRALGKSGSHHFTAKTTACYTCHFNNEGFNTGTTSCLLCHTLPTKEITVHQELTPAGSAKLKSPEAGKQAPIKMDHQTILARKVDCIACHADVARETATVTRRDCERCHDRPNYFTEWKEPASLDLVKHYHAVHIPEQRAKCLDCHAEIHHQLIRGQTATGQPQFLASVMANCSNCHPNHHAEQIELLSGAGGRGVPKGEPNLMFGSRTNCLGCHQELTTTDHGPAVRGSATACVACHGDRHAETFEKWKKSLKVLQTDAEEAYANAQKMLEGAKDLPQEKRRKAADLLSAAQADLKLVKRGNGVHNVMYSIELLDSVTRRCQEATALLAK